MKNKTIKKALVFLSFFAIVAIFTGAVSATNWTVNPGSNIQSVINNASANDTIIVNDNNGTAYTYTENIVVNKTLNITAVSGGNVIVQALNSSKPVFMVNTGGSSSTIQGFTVKGANHGIYLNSANNCIIAGNTISHNQAGVYSYNSSYNMILDNNISNNSWTGLYFLSGSTNNTISGNNITFNDNGVQITRSFNNTFSSNTVSYNTWIGFYTFDDSEYMNYINFNRIAQNGESGIYIEGGVLNATNNWWGSNNPIEGFYYGDDIAIDWGTVYYDPWLVLNITASPTVTNENSTVTADLTHNSAGQNTSSQGHIPDNIPVNFTTNIGTVTGTGYTRNGQANATFNRGTSTSGTANITATLDNQTVQTNITIHVVTNINTGNVYLTIQDAINNASASDTIQVNGGTYTENVVLNKKLTIRPVAGNNVTINGSITINSAGSGSTIQGVTIGDFIDLENAANCSILNNILPYGYNAIRIFSSNNNNISNNTVNGEGYGIYSYYSANNTIVNNYITNLEDAGICTDHSSDIILNNTINSWYNGIETYSSNNTISNNTITSNYGNNYGNGIYSQNSHNNIASNDITYKNYGIYTYNSSDVIQFNRIYRNNYGLKNELGTVTAINNWWGSNYNPEDSICIVSGTVIYNPWLVLSVNSTDHVDGTSNVTADLTHNSSGEDTSSEGHIPDGIPVNFITNFGTIETTAYTSRGKAMSTLNSNGIHGVANVSATLDNQSVFKTVALMGIYDYTTQKGYASIQSAINDPSTSAGDVIMVENGTYTENIVVNKWLNIISSSNATIQATNSSNPVFTVNSYGNGTLIQGFIIKGAINSYGIYLNGASNCNINGNNLTGNYHGIYLTGSNNTVSGNKIVNNNRYGITMGGSNNTIQDNTITSNFYGIYLGHSNNANIIRNTITNSTYGINPQYSSASIHFNRITGNSRFSLVSQLNSTINATNNWWGNNTPSYINSPNWVSTNYDIYNCNSTTYYNPWLILSFDAGSCTSSGVNASIVADLTHNNNGEDTSSKGNVPNGTPVNFTTNFGTIVSPVYTVKGKATTILNLGNTQTRTGTISSSVDRQNISAQFTINSGSATLNILSSALDNSTWQNLNLTYTLPLNSSVSWVSVLWKNTGLFQEELDLILNGNVVVNKTVVNSAYRTYKNSYSQQVFNQINYFNTLFSNSVESKLLLQTIIANNPQLQNLTGTQLTDGILAVIKQNNNFTDSEIDFIKNNHWSFIDPMNIYMYYTGKAGKSINITDPDTNATLTLNFLGNSISMASSITYWNGSFVSQHVDPNTNITYLTMEPSGYEGVKSFSIATTQVTDTILQYWLDKASLYQPGAMKAAYGTFMTALLVEYCHDRIANNATSEFNVTWSRTNPIAVSAGDDAYLTYVTLMCDHDMGMTVTGNTENMAAFRFICSSTISAIEQNVMEGLWFNYQANTPSGSVGSVMTDMANAFMNGTSLEAFESNRYVVLKAVGCDDLVFVIDPETGIVRDMNTVVGVCGAYCYYDLQTELAESLGANLLTANCGWLGILSGIVTTLGSTVIYNTYNAQIPPEDKWWKYGLGLTIAGTGIGLQYYDADLHNEVNPSNLSKFLMGVGFSIIPIFGTGGGVAGETIISYVGLNGIKTEVTHIPATFEGYVITTMPARVGEIFIGGSSGIEPIYVASVQYVKYGTTESVIKTAMGRTPEEAVRNLILSNSIQESFNAIINKYSPEINQYSSQFYNNITEYLSNP